MARLVAPATSPFHSVVSCGVSPSISDVKWLSKPQQTQASATSSPGRKPADCSSHDSSSAAATTSPAPTQPRPLNWSRNSTTPRIAVATSSRLSHSDTDAAAATRSPSSSSTGPAMPPSTTAPASRTWLARSRRTTRRSTRLRTANGLTPSAPPR